MTNAGSRPAAWSIHARSAEVVVLPWVPTTMSACRPAATKRFTAWGIEQKASPSRSSSTASGFVRGTALPTTTRSGRCARFSGRNPSNMCTPRSARKRLIGG